MFPFCEDCGKPHWLKVLWPSAVQSNGVPLPQFGVDFMDAYDYFEQEILPLVVKEKYLTLQLWRIGPDEHHYILVESWNAFNHPTRRHLCPFGNRLNFGTVRLRYLLTDLECALHATLRHHGTRVPSHLKWKK